MDPWLFYWSLLALIGVPRFLHVHPQPPIMHPSTLFFSLNPPHFYVFKKHGSVVGLSRNGSKFMSNYEI